eukprot:gene35954-43607_t
MPIIGTLSAGIMFGVAMCHLLPESHEVLISISSDYTAFTVAGTGLIVVLGVEQLALGQISKSRDDSTGATAELATLTSSGTNQHGHTSAEFYGSVESYSETRYHANGQVKSKSHCHHQHGVALIHTLNHTASVKELVTLYILELSVAIHSIILGVSFGVETGYRGILVLGISLTIHQFIEGVAMGSMLKQYKDTIQKLTMTSFLLVFSASISVGVVVGMITSAYSATAWFRFMQGICGSVAAGTLLYVSLVEQLAVQFSRRELEHREVFQTSSLHQHFASSFTTQLSLETALIDVPEVPWGLIELSIKIGMIFLFFSVSLGGSFLPIFSPKWMIEGSTIPVLCSLSAGTMLGVALAHLLPESNEALEGAVSDYSLAFALCGLGVILVLAVEQITIALIAKWKAGNKFRSSKDLLQPIGCVISPEGSNQSGDEDVEC